MMRQGWDVPFFSILIAATLIPLLPQPGSIPAFAQEKADASEPAALILGTVASERGTTATIPLYYKPTKDNLLRSLHVEVEFVSNNVKFAKAEKGLAAETQDFDLAVQAKELPPDDKQIQRTRLNIDVSIVNPDPMKSLPEGLWAFLNFTIPPEAKPFAIALTPISISAQDQTQKAVKVAGEAGKIIVSIPDTPLAGCFFFNH